RPQLERHLHWPSLRMVISSRDYQRLAKALVRTCPCAIEEVGLQLRRLCRHLGIAVVRAVLVLTIATCVCAPFVAMMPRGPGGRMRQARSYITMLFLAIEHWHADHPGHACPATLDELFTEKYITRRPRDPWGEEFLYRCPSNLPEEVEIGSKGQDRIAGTEDDLSSVGITPPVSSVLRTHHLVGGGRFDRIFRGLNDSRSTFSSVLRPRGVG